MLNQDAILFWEKGDDNAYLLQRVEELQNNDRLYKEFFEQPRLKADAWQVVANYFAALEQHLNELFR